MQPIVILDNEFLGQNFSGEIFRGKPESPPQIIDALQKAHSALFLSTPAISPDPAQLKAHKAAYQAVADVLVELRMLRAIT